MKVTIERIPAPPPEWIEPIGELIGANFGHAQLGLPTVTVRSVRLPHEDVSRFAVEGDRRNEPEELEYITVHALLGREMAKVITRDGLNGNPFDALEVVERHYNRDPAYRRVLYDAVGPMWFEFMLLEQSDWDSLAADLLAIHRDPTGTMIQFFHGKHEMLSLARH